MHRLTETAVLVAAVAGVVAGCRDVTADDASGVVCTLEARPGLLVTVRDSVTGAAVSDAQVGARRGAAADTARGGAVRSDGALYALAHERPGTYAVRVERAGYRVWERAGVEVSADRCHVRTVALTALLQP